MDTAKLLLEQRVNPGFIGNVSSIIILLRGDDEGFTGKKADVYGQDGSV